MADDLAAGAELDAAVARLLGQVVRDVDVCPMFKLTQGTDHSGGRHDVVHSSVDYCCRAMVPRYSSDWAAMGALVAHLVGDGWQVVISVPGDLLADNAQCDLYRGVGATGVIHVQRGGQTAPLATARAALRTAHPSQYSERTDA